MEISDSIAFPVDVVQARLRAFEGDCQLSGRQMLQKDLVATVEQVLTETGLAPDGLELEITASTLTEYAQDTLEFAEPAAIG